MKKRSYIGGISTLIQYTLVLAMAFALNRETKADSYIKNPGFEQPDGVGGPAFWNNFRQGMIDSNAALTHTGNVSVRSSSLFGWMQQIPSPVSPYQSFAITGFANRELDFEQPRIWMNHFTSGAQFIRETSDSSPLPAFPGYQPFWSVHQLPTGASQFEMFLGARNGRSWIRYDDLHLYTEQLQTSGTLIGEPWSLESATENSGILTLSGGAKASQRVVSGRENQAYFISALATSGAPTSLTLTETSLPRGGSETTASASTDVQLPAGPFEFIADIPLPSGTPSGQTRVTIDVSLGGQTALSNIRRGFAKVEPSIHTVGVNSPDTPILFTGAWPTVLTTATVAITNSNSDLVINLPVTVHGSSIRATWDAATATSGTYTARFGFTSNDSTIEVSRPVTIYRNETLQANVQPVLPTDFTRGAWLFFIHSDSLAYVDDAIRLARSDGFNYAMMHCRPDQFATIRAAAEREGLPFFVHSDPGNSLFFRNLAREYFSREEYTNALRQIYSPLLSSPMFRGIYVVDEPGYEGAWDLTQRAMLSIAQEGDLGAPFSTFVQPTPPATIAAMQPGVLMVDHYPFRTSEVPDNTAALLSYIPKYSLNAQTAASFGRQHWLVSQGFWAYEGETFRSVPPSMYRAQLGAAILAGAKGIIPFTYTQISYIEGLRSPNLEPTNMLPAHIEFNALMDRLNDVIMPLDTPVLDTRAPTPFAASIAENPVEGTRYLIALNADEFSTRTLEVQFASPPLAVLTDIVAQRPLTAITSSNRGLLLGPGDFAMMEIGSAVITGYTASSGSPPPSNTLNLESLYQFTVQPGSNSVTVPIGLSFNADATAIAVSTPFTFSPTRSQVFQLLPGGTVQEQPLSGTFWPEKREFLSDGSLAALSPLLGFSAYSGGSFSGPLLTSFMGYSGGAYHVVKNAAGEYWATLDGLGIRHIASGSINPPSLEISPSESQSYRDLFGPFADASIAVLILDTGVDRIEPGSTDEQDHDRAPLRRVQENASINSNGIIAAPRGPRGISLFKAGSGMAPEHLADITTGLEEAVATAWITDDILAVANGIRNVIFYQVTPDFQANLIGSYRPPAPGPFYIRSLAARNKRLAIGLHDGTVHVVNAAPVTVTAAHADWQLYP